MQGSSGSHDDADFRDRLCVFYVDEKPLTDVNGKMVGTMYAESFVENPGEQINSIQNTNLTLYFPIRRETDS